jgi:DNA-binding winged helix-turn-helix (wHTH) protein/tetratricopeptide (TPR) repeat protein
MTIYRFGPFRLEKERLLLYVEGTALPLGPKVVETLLVLVERAGEVLGKCELLDRVWPEGFVDEANLAQNVYIIRKTLRRYWSQEIIQTVPRRGYRFTGEVCEESVAAAPRLRPAAPPAPRPFLQARRVAAAALMLLAALGGGVVFAGAHSGGTRPHALSPAGARLYAIGKYYWNQRTAPAIAKSERYFESVIARDPRDARGYAALASAYAIEGDYGFGPLARKTSFARAAVYARRALAFDRSSAEAYAVLGLVDVDQGRMPRAFAEYRRSLQLDPSVAAAHQWYGAALLLDGKAADAYAELQKAANLDPESVAATDWLAQAAFVARHYGDAVAYGRQVLDLSPQRYNAYQTIGSAYEALGNERAAIAAYVAYGGSCRECRYDSAALLARAYALAHENVRAQAELRIAQHGFALHDVSEDNMVAALLALGQKSDALRVLARSKSGEPTGLLAIDPRLDAMRNDERFRRYTQSPG